MSPAVWENLINTSRSPRPTVRVIPHQADVRNLEGRQAPRHVPDEGHAAVAEVKQPGGDQSTDDEYQRAGHPRREPPDPEDDDQRDDTDDHGRLLPLAEGSQPRPQFLEGIVAAGLGAGELGKLTDDDIDGSSEQESGDHGT
jgi:hypothetical protein